MSILEALLSDMGTTVTEMQTRRGGGPLSALFRAEGVEHSSEVDRVASLPRRDDVSEELIDLLTAFLILPGGVGRLRKGQVAALREMYQARGLFAPMPCGTGKTLVTLLAPTLLGSVRPVLMVPKGLVEKTRREFCEYRQNWNVRLPRILGYEMLSVREFALDELAPDLLMADEAHMIRNDSGRTRRVRRYIEAHPECVYAPMSGTLITDRLMDMHHLAVDALKDKAPVPLRPVDAERWALSLDRDIGTARRIAPGALERLPGGFHEHLRGTAGVVYVPGSDCASALEIERWSPPLPETLRTIINQVEASDMRPDGEMLNEMETPSCLSMLALGFYQVWDPLPPDWWLQPRRYWWAYERAVLEEKLPGYDTPKQIRDALDGREEQHGQEFLVRGKPLPPYATEGRQLLASWRAVKDQFEPNSVPVWLDRSVMDATINLVEARGWLVWTRWRAAGQALASLGLPYFGGGQNPEPLAGQSCAVSIAAHGTGKNLQAWHTSLCLTPPGKNVGHEQFISRTHREGQTADLVRVKYLDVIDYHGNTLDRVLAQARATGKASGFGQKLVDATWV